jgi:homoserine dehydrogenase
LHNLRVAYLGFGTVNRALDALIAARASALAHHHGIVCETVGSATRRQGWQAAGRKCADIEEWLDAAKPDVVFEAIPLDPHAGQPALDYLRAILGSGAHAISANKGPLVYGFRELATLSKAYGCAYHFESAVMDGAPVFSLVRECLPYAGLKRVSGVFTSTATVVIEAIERGLSIEDGIREAQRFGIAESDPEHDIDGMDTAVKLCAIANVLFGAELRPSDVERRGVRTLAVDEIRRAHAEGEPYRLVGEVMNGNARVAPARCSAENPLGIVRGATLVMHYEADVFPGGLTIASRDPDPTTTAFGMFADMIAVLTSRLR